MTLIASIFHPRESSAEKFAASPALPLRAGNVLAVQWLGRCRFEGGGFIGAGQNLSQAPVDAPHSLPDVLNGRRVRHGQNRAADDHLQGIAGVVVHICNNAHELAMSGEFPIMS